jgi:hypothetical protein
MKCLSVVAHHLAEYLLTEKLFMFMTSRPNLKPSSRTLKHLSSGWAIGQFSEHRYYEKAPLWV